MPILRTSIATNAGILATSQLFAAALGLLAALAAARVLGPRDYGAATLVLAFPSLVRSLLMVKSGSVTTRYIAAYRAAGRKDDLASIVRVGYTIDLVVAVASVLVVVASASAVSSLMRLPDETARMVLFAASFPVLSLNGTSMAVLTSFGSFRYVSAVQVIERAVGLAVLLGMLLLGRTIDAVVLSAAIEHVFLGVATAVGAARALSKFGIRHWWRADRTRVRAISKELWSALRWNYVVITFDGVLLHVPTMILGRVAGANAVAFYRVATSITTTASHLELALGRVAYPVLAEGTSKHELRRMIADWQRLALASGFVVLVTVPLLPLAIPIVFGESYRGMTAGTQVLVVGAAVSATFFWLQSYYYASGRVRTWALAYGALALLTVGAGWPVAREYGFIGLAIVVATARVAFNFVLGFRAAKRDQVPGTANQANGPADRGRRST